MTKAKLEKLYSDFWLQYSKVLPENVTPYPLRGSPFRVKDEGNGFGVTLAVDLRSLRYKSSSPVKNIAVRIRGNKHCVFTAADSRITLSNVRVNYFRMDNARREMVLLESLHYDYEANANSLRNHPIFHCQSCNDLIRDPFFERKDFDFVGERKFIHQHLRIPTANMDMISVLLSIAADHFTLQEFERVLKVYDDGGWHLRLPHTPHHERFSPGTCFRSRAWYIG